MKLSIIIVSYNTKELLRLCLQAVHKSSFPDKFEVIVVDNNSVDGSTSMVQDYFPQVKVILNHENLGYSRANNQGIHIATGEYILLLNSDTEVVTTALDELVKFMQLRPQAGVASAQLLYPNGSIQPSGGYLPRLSSIAAWMLLIDHVQPFKRILRAYHVSRLRFYEFTHQLGWVQGAAMIVRRKMLEAVGALDENIFMYGEDVELCMRAKQAGWQVWTVAQAQVIHKAFQSSGGVSTNALLGEYTGLVFYFKKHKPAWEIPMLRILLKAGALIRMLIFGTILRDTRKYAVYKQAFSLAG